MTKEELILYQNREKQRKDAEDEAIEFLHLMIKFGFQRALSLMSAKKSKENNAK